MKFLVTLIFYFLAASNCYAACAPGYVLFTGSVVDATGAPVVGVPVAVAGVLLDRTVGPALALTDDTGRYRILLEYNSTSGTSIFGRDRCDAELREATVAAYDKKLRSDHVLVELAGKSSVDVAPLRLTTPVEREPTWPEAVQP